MSIHEKIHQLLWDRRYVRIPDDICVPEIEYVLIKDMNIEDRNLYSFVRSKELELARKQGVQTEVEILAEARKAGLWTDQDELILEKADEHIAFLKAEQSKQKFLARKKSIELDIESTIKKKNISQTKRNDYFINSAEYYASEVAASTLIRRLIYTIDNNLLWPTDESFLNFKRDYIGFIIFITNEVLSEGLWPTDELREIARNPEWRLTWVLQKEDLPSIFNRTIGDLTLNQKLVIYWSRVYDSAFESTEPPSMEIINDDEKFDEWLANREISEKEKHNESRISTKDHQERMQVLDGEYSEICNCGAKAKNIGKGLGERMQHTNVCPYGTFKRYSYDEREKIAKQMYARNSDRVRTLLEQEQQAVIANGEIEEQHLRGTKTRHVLGMKTDVVSLNRK